MIPDSVAVVLLILFLGATYQALLWHSYAKRLEGRLDVGHEACYPNLQRASQTAEPYDWERDGL